MVLHWHTTENLVESNFMSSELGPEPEEGPGFYCRENTGYEEQLLVTLTKIQGYVVAYRTSLDEELYASYMAVPSTSTSYHFSLIAGVDVQTWKLALNTVIAYWKEQTHRLLFAMLSTVPSLFTRE